MAISEAMDEIDESIEHVFDASQLKDERDTARSRESVYEKALTELRDVAGEDAMWELQDWIVRTIEHRGEPPDGRTVRQEGARIAREHGAEISTNDFLGA